MEPFAGTDFQRKRRKEFSGSASGKILYWGMAGSGKTTIIDTLYRYTKEKEQDIAPIGKLTKISMASGATLYFDRGIFFFYQRESGISCVYCRRSKKVFPP